MNHRRRLNHESPYWPAFVDVLVALLAVVMLAGTVPLPHPKPPDPPPSLIGPGPGPGGGHPLTPPVTWVEFHGRFLAEKVRTNRAGIESSIGSTHVQLAGDALTVIVGGLPTAGGDRFELPAADNDTIQGVWNGLFPRGVQAEFLRDLGLQVAQVKSYAYADKIAGTSTGVNSWLRASDQKLKLLAEQISSPSRVRIDIEPYYPDSPPKTPYVGVKVVFGLDKNGEQDALAQYKALGGHQ